MSGFSVRFLDSFRFIASSLAELAWNLFTKPGDFEKFRETAKVFQPTDMLLVTRKGVFPYEYTDKWSRLEETTLPSKREFYSMLTEKHISDEDYIYAVEVWRHFNRTTLDDYSDLYFKVDVLLLADVMENFRDLCMSTYNPTSTPCIIIIIIIQHLGLRSKRCWGILEFRWSCWWITIWYFSWNKG